MKKYLHFIYAYDILLLVVIKATQVNRYAVVAELADALDSGSSGGCTVGVQVPSTAP